MFIKRALLVILSISLVVMTACKKDSDNPVEPTPEVSEFDTLTAAGDVYFTNYVTPAGRGVNISVGGADGLFELLTDGDTLNDPFLIDYRSAADYATGHIIGTVNIALADLFVKIDDGTIPTDKRIVNICYTGQTASVATSVLNLLGYEAQNLTFGMCGVTTADTINGTHRWLDQIAADEFTLTTTPTGAPTQEFTFPDPGTGKSALEEIVRDRFAYAISAWGKTVADVMGSPADYFVINYWSAADYNTIGHLEGSYQFTPKVSLQKDEMLKYLPTDKKIAIYCWTGQTSAQVAAYLRLLGYDAYSMYYGVNGFAYGALTSSKYTAPAAGAYSLIITE